MYYWSIQVIKQVNKVILIRTGAYRPLPPTSIDIVLNKKNAEVKEIAPEGSISQTAKNNPVKSQTYFQTQHKC